MSNSAPTLRFLGATGTVTGSRYLLEVDGKRILVDCGLFQGYKELRERNRKPFPVPADTIDAILLTHAHLDHSGYLPAMVRDGYRGPIISSLGTAELCSLLLPDSAHLLEEEAARAKRKKYSKHNDPTPLYTEQDAELALSLFRTVEFGEVIEVVPGVKVTFSHAGHILGASQLHLELGGRTLHFTGDLGRVDDILMNGPAPYEGSDILITESTYGDREHPLQDAGAELQPILSRVLGRGGVVVIPAFAVGRSQALMLIVSRLMAKGVIPTVPVFVNSPMATSATEMYERHRDEHRVDGEEFVRMYDSARLVKTVEESKKLNERKGPMIIIAASGMMTGGRVLHHVVAFGEDPNNAILLSGYQAGGTRGRLLSEGAQTLRIFGHDIPIRAEVMQLQSMSGHADASQIIDWMRTAPTPPKQVFVTHGEPDSADALRFRIQDELHWKVRVPSDGETVEL
jgi:metallo-beta-lactamase family protein